MNYGLSGSSWSFTDSLKKSNQEKLHTQITLCSVSPLGEVKLGETEGDREENVQKRQSFFKCSGAITEYNTLRNKWHDKESRQTHSQSSTIIWMTATGTTIIVTRELEQIICDKNKRGKRTGQRAETKKGNETHAFQSSFTQIHKNPSKMKN